MTLTVSGGGARFALASVTDVAGGLRWPGVFDEDLAVGVDEDDGLLVPEHMDVLAGQSHADLVADPFYMNLSDLVDLPDLITCPSAVRLQGQRLRPISHLSGSIRCLGLHRCRCWPRRVSHSGAGPGRRGGDPAR